MSAQTLASPWANVNDSPTNEPVFIRVPDSRAVPESEGTHESLLTDLFHDLLTVGVPLLLVIAAGTLVYFANGALPSPQDSSAPLSTFSEGRALNHVTFLAQSPRAVDDPHNTASYLYLVESLLALVNAEGGTSIRSDVTVELSYTPIVTTTNGTEGTLSNNGIPFYITRSTNIAVRISPKQINNYFENGTLRSDGDSSVQTVLFATNYDTTASSRGAGENAAGVATLLEVISNFLHSDAKISNNLIFLFANAVNIYSVGIDSFVSSHPWGDDANVFISLWPGGVGGKSLLSAAYSADALALYAKTAPHPWANGVLEPLLTYGLMQQSSNIKKQTYGCSVGLVFENYRHRLLGGTGKDTPNGLNSGSLQHVGDNTRAFLFAIASENVQDWRSRSEATAIDIKNVFFDFLGVLCLVVPMPIYAVVTAVVMILALAYLIMRIKISAKSKWNKHVGTVSVRILFAGFGVILISLLLSFVPVLVIGFLVELSDIVMYAHCEGLIAAFSGWIVLFVVGVQFLVQDKLPVTFRAGTERWVHHMELACILFWLLATALCLGLSARLSYSIPLWLFATWLRVMLDHLLRIIPHPHSVNEQSQEQQQQEQPQPLPDVHEIRERLEKRQQRARSAPQSKRNSSGGDKASDAQKRKARNHKSHDYRYLDPNNGLLFAGLLGTQSDLSDDNSVAAGYSRSTTPPAQQGDGNDMGSSNAVCATAPICVVTNPDSDDEKVIVPGAVVATSMFVPPSMSSLNGQSPLMAAGDTLSEIDNPVHTSSPENADGNLQARRSFGFREIKEKPFSGPWFRRHFDEKAPTFARSFVHVVQLLLCVCVPCIVHVDLCFRVTTILEANLRSPLAWGMLTVVFVFPVLTVFLPDLHRVRRIYGFFAFCLLVAVGTALSVLFLTDFTSTRPNIVQVHHVQQTWHAPNEASKSASVVFMQATNIHKVRGEDFPYDSCVFQTVNHIKRCQVTLPDNELKIPFSTPTVYFNRTEIVHDYTHTGVRESATLAVTVRPSSCLFAIDVSNLGLQTGQSVWYGQCSPSSQQISPYHNSSGSPIVVDVCTRADVQTWQAQHPTKQEPGSEPIDMSTTKVNLMVYPGDCNATYYFEIVQTSAFWAPMAVLSFFSEQHVSSIVNDLIGNLPSWMTVRGTFLGPAHAEEYWYF